RWPRQQWRSPRRAPRLRYESLLFSWGEGIRYSGEQRRGFCDALFSAPGQGMERLAEPLVHHSGTNVGPARCLVLLSQQPRTIVDLSADDLFERVDIESGLLSEPRVEEGADLEELVHGLVDLL